MIWRGQVGTRQFGAYIVIYAYEERAYNDSLLYIDSLLYAHLQFMVSIALQRLSVLSVFTIL